jgi:hypothetical protein
LLAGKVMGTMLPFGAHGANHSDRADQA